MTEFAINNDEELMNQISKTSGKIGDIARKTVRGASAFLAISAAISAPTIALIFSGVADTTHRLLSAVDPRGTHPGIYKELDVIKEELEELKNKVGQ